MAGNKLKPQNKSNHPTCIAHRTHLPRDTLAAAAAIYHEMYAERDEDSGEVVLPATFEVCHGHAQ